MNGDPQQVVTDKIDNLRINKTMSGPTRAVILLAGSALAFIGCIIPGVYSVSYSPPIGAGYPSAGDRQLSGFNGVFNAFQGPFSFSPVVVSIICLAILGLLAPLVHPKKFGATIKHVTWGVGHVLHTTVGLAAGIVTIVFFIWDYRYQQSPQSIRNAFVARLGGGTVARDASHFVSGGLGAATLIILVGLMIAEIGILAKPFAYVLGGLLALLLLGCCLGVAGVRVPYLINDNRYDNRSQPLAAMSHCFFEHGAVDSCVSASPSITVDLPDQAGNATSCKSTLAIDWGDGTAPQTVEFTGSAAKPGYLATHIYKAPGQYAVAQTESTKSAGCRVGGAKFTYTWRK